MLHQFLISIKNFADPTVLGVIVLISLFEFFIDRPALKKQGHVYDAKITSIISIVGVFSAVAMAIITRFIK
ncbi:MAG: hypothetical protein PHC44_12180 [Lutispora sp.]|nr:hypothetical protein [Lutispora sp.]